MPQTEQFLVDLTSSDESRAEAAAAALISIGELALDGLMPLLDSPSAETRWWALRALAGIPHERSSQALARALSDPDRMVRQAAALGLRLQPSPTAAASLAELLADPDPMVARLASDALAVLGPPALAPLRQTLGAAHPAARIQATRALSLMKNRQAVPDLFAALEDDSALVRHWAERGLDDLEVGMAFFYPD